MIPSDFAIDHASHSIILQRDLAASPATVFAAWTKADILALWWDPNGAPLAECSIDLRIGGGFRCVNKGQGSHAFAATYTRLDPPHLIEFDAMGAQGAVRLTAGGAGTLMQVVMTCASAQHLDQFIAMGIALGTATTLDRLQRHVAQA